MKKFIKVFVLLLTLSLVTPPFTIVAQDDAWDSSGGDFWGQDSSPSPAPEPQAHSGGSESGGASDDGGTGDTGGGGTTSSGGGGAPRASSVGHSGTALINTIIGYLSQIGGIFGNVTGFRIGGTTGSGILALVLAKLLENKSPSWVKWLLCLGGGTMFAGGGANIVQMIMNNL